MDRLIVVWAPYHWKAAFHYSSFSTHSYETMGIRTFRTFL